MPEGVFFLSLDARQAYFVAARPFFPKSAASITIFFFSRGRAIRSSLPMQENGAVFGVLAYLMFGTCVFFAPGFLKFYMYSLQCVVHFFNVVRPNAPVHIYKSPQWLLRVTLIATELYTISTCTGALWNMSCPLLAFSQLNGAARSGVCCRGRYHSPQQSGWRCSEALTPFFTLHRICCDRTFFFCCHCRSLVVGRSHSLLCTMYHAQLPPGVMSLGTETYDVNALRRLLIASLCYDRETVDCPRRLVSSSDDRVSD